MLKDSLGGFLLLIGRVAVLAQDALDQAPQVGAGVFAYRPVNRNICSDGLDKFLGTMLWG